MSSSYKESVLLGYCNIHDWDRCLFRNYCFPVNILFPRPFRRTIINNINSRFYVGCKISLIKIRFSQIIFNAFSNWSLIHFLFLSYFFFKFLIRNIRYMKKHENFEIMWWKIQGRLDMGNCFTFKLSFFNFWSSSLICFANST